MTLPTPTPEGKTSGSNRMMIIVLIIVMVVGAVIVTTVVVLRPSNEIATTTVAAPAVAPGAPAPVLLEPISSASDPFAPPMGQDEAVAPVKTTGPVTVEGGRVGLYGGTMNSSQCDKNQLTTFLQENPDKGAAWAGVMGIPPAEIPTYIDRLTPVLLRSDTAVTNHGFMDGQASSIQSVLQAGTAVLVDDKGVPVTKCYCGNPLQPPTPITPSYPAPTTTTNFENTTTTFNNNTTTTYGYQPPTYYGPQWPEWNPVSITIIQVNITVINVYVLVDWETGTTFERPVGTDGSQDKATNEPVPALPTPTPNPSSNPSTNPSSNPTQTTTSTTYYYPDEPCVDEHNNIVPCNGYPTTTHPYYPPTTYYYPDEPCVDEFNNIVPC